MLYPYSMRGDLTMIPDNRFPRSGLEGDHQLLGALHYDYAFDVRPLHELHPAAEEDPSCARDGAIYFRRYVAWHTPDTQLIWSQRPWQLANTSD